MRYYKEIEKKSQTKIKDFKYKQLEEILKKKIWKNKIRYSQYFCFCLFNFLKISLFFLSKEKQNYKKRNLKNFQRKMKVRISEKKKSHKIKKLN